MKLFDKRPLSLILCIFLIGLFLFSDLSITANIIISSISVAFVIFIIILPRLFGKLKGILIASSVMLLISSLLSLFYFNLYFDLYKRYENEESVSVRGTIYEITEYTDGYTLLLKDISINENNHSNKIYCFIDKEECDIIIRPLKIISFTARIEEHTSSSESTALYYRSQGITAKATDITDITDFGEASADLLYRLGSYRQSISEYIIKNTDTTGGGLLSALLIGERNYISGSTHLAFERTGTLHILAISGMHLVLLMNALNSLLKFFLINKKIRKIIEIIVCISYTVLLGFPLSVCRASLMLLISAILYFIATDADSITSLFIAVSIICVILPYSIYDISLWLSAFATFGILVYTELMTKLKPKGFIFKLLLKILSPIIISIFAISFTLVFSILSFNSISLIGPIVTIILSVLIEYFMYLGIAFLVLSPFVSIGGLVSLYGNLIIKIINVFSQIKGIYVGAEAIFIKILVITLSILVVVFLVLDIKKKKAFLLILLSLFVSINAIALINDRVTKNEDDIEYILSGSCDFVLLKSDGKCILIDATKPSQSTAYRAVDAVYKSALREVDTYVYINYSETIYSSLNILTSNININEIYMPAPYSENEKDISEKLSASTSIMIKHFNMGEYIFFNDYTLLPYYREENRNRCAYLLFDNGKVTTYLSSGMLYGNTNAVAESLIDGTDTVIFARNGDRYYNYVYDSVYNSVEIIIVSSKGFKVFDEIKDYYDSIEIVEAPERISIKH